MDKEEQKVLKLALQVALDSRQETFLAHYPRMFKVAVLGVVIAGLLSVSLFLKEQAPSVSLQDAMEQDAWVERVDRYKEHYILGDPMLQIPEEIEVVRATRNAVPVSALEKKAAAFNDNYSHMDMAPAPNPAFVDSMSLPKIARDGRHPWEEYARPFDLLDPRPRIALVMVDMGLSRIATDAAIHRLPAPVTLAFDVQGSSIRDWLARARSDGHETLLSVPMEPVDYPRNDPGPGSLLMSLSNHENVGRLNKFLALGSGYVGVTTMSGTRFLNEPQKVRPVIDVMRKRGLLMLDSEVSANSALGHLAREQKVPFAVNNIVIDKQPAPHAIDKALARVEKLAMTRGRAVAIASPLPITLERLQLWLATLKGKGFAVAPLSAVAVH